MQVRTGWRRAAVVGVAVVGAVGTMVAPAAADPIDVAGTGAVGVVTAVVSGSPVAVGPLAPCSIGSGAAGTTQGTTIDNVLSYGTGSSSCSIDPATGFGDVRVNGKRFRLDLLKRYGGPTIKISSFAAGCKTTVTGSTGTISLSGLSGITVPQSIPANFTVNVAGSTPQSPLVARIVINEKIVPNPPDGSMTVNLMRVTMFPNGGGTASGDIVVGQVHCDPDDF